MMIWVDYTIIGLIVISLVIGLLRGILKEALALSMWVIGICIGLIFSSDLSVWLQPTIELPIARIGMAFGILFFTTLLVGGIIELLLTELINKTGLTISDRFAGMIFGAGRGLVVVSLCIMLAGLTSLPEDPWWKESILIPPFQTLAIWIREHIPFGLASYVNYH